MKVPPLTRGTATQRRDWMTKEGAHALGEMTAAAWRKLGHEVPFVVENVTAGQHNREIYAPRFPTMINGVPT